MESAPATNTCPPRRSKEFEQRRPAALIEMGRNLIQERDRDDARRVSDEPRMREHESDEQSLLLSGRGDRRWRILRTVPDRQIADMGTDRRSSGCCVSAAIVPQNPAIAVFGFDRGFAGGKRLELPFEREPRPGKWRGVVPIGRNQRFEPAQAFVSRRRDCDAEFRHLAFDRIEPGGVAPAPFEQAIAPP